MYCAIIGDIVDSKKIKNRKEIQTKLENVLLDINRNYEVDIAANFVITLGDEFQGLLKLPGNLTRVIELIKMELYPIKLRFGAGIGEIYTEINPIIAIGADGPAYYNAREAIDIIKKESNMYEKPYQDVRYHLNSDKLTESNNLINALLSSCSLIESKWTIKQREVIKLAYIDSLSQKEISAKLELKNSSIQRRIDSAGYYTFISALNAVDSFVSKLWEEYNG